VRAALASVAGVDAVEAQPGSGCPTYVVHMRGGEPTRAAVAAALVSRGWDLVEMRPLAMTLEELFLHLVRERRGSSAA
jgi:hypothetical protein